MAQQNGQFKIIYAWGETPPVAIEKDALLIGRLKSGDVVLDHPAVSRVHAGVNFLDATYFLINLSSSNVLTLNGRSIEPQSTDVLSDGDIVQIGPFAIAVTRRGGELGLTVQPRTEGEAVSRIEKSGAERQSGAHVNPAIADVLKVFWEKRTRDKEDWGTRLRPAARPEPGKAAVNWKPTRDLRRPWRVGIFVWTIVVFAVLALLAFEKYPQAYAGKPLASPHVENVQNSTIANAPNANSCITCHTPNEPIENACIRCHQASQFHPSNTKAHEEAGITCVVCHRQHEGNDFRMTASAIESCAACHNDANEKTYNGRTVRTAHSGSYGYPAENGTWKWRGVYRETADAIPEINASATGDADEQARLSRHFHSVHVARLNAPAGLTGDSRGLVSCSTCHKTFSPVDRVTPRETCAACHTMREDSSARDARFGTGDGGDKINCISCHVQHPYSSGRWREFLTEAAFRRRQEAVENHIKQTDSK